jgi:FkbM family methyltransferase
MYKKIISLPFAVTDILKVLLHNKVSLKQKFAVAKALISLKFFSLKKNTGDFISFSIGKYIIHACYSKSLGFLIKEIFISEVYAVSGKTTVTAILDVGANIGLSVAYYKTKHPFAAITACEPDKDSFTLLQQNAIQNNWQQLTILPVAVSNANEILYQTVVNEKASVNSRFKKNGTEKETAVTAKDICDILNKQFDIVKIDIEGSEWSVLERVIEKNYLHKSNNWFIEFHNIEQNNVMFKKIMAAFEAKEFLHVVREEVFYFFKKN